MPRISRLQPSRGTKNVPRNNWLRFFITTRCSRVLGLVSASDLASADATSIDVTSRALDKSVAGRSVPTPDLRFRRLENRELELRLGLVLKQTAPSSTEVARARAQVFKLRYRTLTWGRAQENHRLIRCLGRPRPVFVGRRSDGRSRGSKPHVSSLGAGGTNYRNDVSYVDGPQRAACVAILSPASAG